MALQPLSPPASSILELIGRTPMVRLNRLSPNPRVAIYAKLEGFNPTGSIKDRIALSMINQLAHYAGTAREMLEQVGGKVDAFVSALGTSGTLMGVGLALKEQVPGVQIVSAHPVLGHYIQGLKNLEEAIVPAIYDETKVDRHVMVESEAAFELARRIAREEGIFVGMSSGAALLAARTVAAELDEGIIVTIFPDRGEKYLSTALFQV